MLSGQDLSKLCTSTDFVINYKLQALHLEKIFCENH